ncbi:ATP-binding protein [Candidatus Saccharibacteria bacterium]|nr:ATP-binding protein [Candidatus Saccharibacteria bacterium]
MLTTSVIILVVISALAVVMGLSLIVGGRINQRLASFLGIIFSAAGWTFFIDVFLLSHNTTTMLTAAVLYYTFAAGIAVFSLLFALTYAGKLKKFHAFLTTLPFVLFMILIAIKPNLMIANFAIAWTDQNVVVLNQLFYSVYVVLFLAYYAVAGVIWIRLLLAAKHTQGRSKTALKIIFLGYLVAGLVGGTFNLIMPWFGIYTLIWVGPISVFFFVIINYIAILREDIFDIKDTIIRLLSYCVAIVGVAIVYLTALSAMFRYLFNIENPSWEIYAVNLIMLIVGIMILPLISEINDFLGRIFYSDSYKIDTIISELNTTIVKTHDTEKLLSRAAKLVCNTLRTSFVTFVAPPGSDNHWKVAGYPTRSLSESDQQLISDFVRQEDQRIIFVDLLDSDAPIIADLKKHRVALIVQIRYEVSTVTESHQDDMAGYMLVGQKKKRGSSFIQKDLDMLEAMSSLMAVAIENDNYYQQIRSFDDNLHKSIKIATSKLRSTNRKLHKLDTSKDEFISMASHQLRTPLTSIKGYLSMVLEGDGGKLAPTQQHFLGEAYQSSLRMARIINELLDVSRIQAGKFVVDAAQHDLAKIVKEEVAHLTDDAKNHQLKLVTDIEPGDYMVLVDDLKIRQTISNLIDNAVFYSNPGGVVTVRLSQTALRVKVEVIDTGIGVPKNEIKNLFVKYARATNAQKRRPDGTGVGLFLSQKVVTALGGDMFVKSVENKGSTFGFWLPK